MDWTFIEHSHENWLTYIDTHFLKNLVSSPPYALWFKYLLAFNVRIYFNLLKTALNTTRITGAETAQFKTNFFG
jgi:hypothetical protein